MKGLWGYIMINRKKGILSIIAIAVMASMTLTACFSERAQDEDIDGAMKILGRAQEKENAQTQNIPEEDLHSSYIEPLGMEYDTVSVPDCTVNALFNVKDFDTEAGTLTFTAYTEELFDAVEIGLMQIGDTLKIGGSEIVVESIQDVNGDLIVNGGFEEGGAELTSAGGGTYKARSMDNYPTYIELGRSTLPISEELTISDSYKDAASPKTATYEELQDYLDGLDGASDSFNYVSTTVMVDKGKVVDITRNWVP